MQELNGYQDLEKYQGIDEEDTPVEAQPGEVTPENQVPYSTTRNNDGEIEAVYDDGPKNAQEVLGKTPQPAQSQEEADKDYQGSLITEAADWMSEKLLGRSKEDSQAAREGGRAQQAQIQEKQDNSFAGEAVKAVTSGVDKAVQNTIGAANFVGDFAKTRLGLVDEDDVWNNTDHKNYIGSQRDLVMAEPRSAAGEMARDLVSFVVMAKGAGKATGLSGVAAGSAGAKKYATVATIGAIADFMADPTDGNAATAVQEAFPATKDLDILSVFAHQAEDDEFTRRLKNTVEGGVMGVAVDGVTEALGGLFKAAAPLLKWKKANPMKAAADAPKDIQEEAFEQLQLALDETLKEGQKSLDLEATGYTPRPGKKARLEEDIANGGTKSRQDYEPYERAAKTSETPMIKVLADQDIDNKRMPHSVGSPSPRLTDNTVKQLLDAGAEMEPINRAIKELDNYFTPALKAKDPAVVKEAQQQLAKLIEANTGEKVDMSALLEVTGKEDEAAAYIQQQLGNVVAKVFLKDLSVQAAELAQQAGQIVSSGMDANRQYNLIIDRLEAVAALQIRDGSRRGGALKTLQGAIGLSGKEATEKKIKTIVDKFEDVRTRLNQGDPDAQEDMQLLTEALGLADGDADLAMSFSKKFADMSSEMFRTTMYNSYLSGINTQGRNIAGNSINVILKPMQIAMGAANNKQRKSALAMYAGMWNDLGEGLAVARSAMKDNHPDKISKLRSGSEAFDSMNMRQKVENVMKSAKTPAERQAARFLNTQYWFTNQPWMKGATRLLDASDRGFRAMSARQKARFDANMLALDDGEAFDPKKFDTVWSTKFKNGEIVDEDLLNWAKQDTFQEDLTLGMQRMADMLNSNWYTKLIVPFFKTPTNIIKATGQMVPMGQTTFRVINRGLDTAGLDFRFFKEWDEVMNGSDETMKAVYKGREATGAMVATIFGGLGSMGMATGRGPADPQKNKLWREEGNQPHSIKVGDVWVSNRFLGPIGILMSAYSDLGYVASHAGSYDGLSELSTQLLYTTAGSLAEQSWLQGLTTGLQGTMEILQGRSDLNPDEWVATVARAMTPYQAALRSWNNTLVPGVRDYNNAMERYLAETVPLTKQFVGSERISMRTGKPVYNQGYSALNQLVPFGMNEVRTDPVLGKLTDMGVKFPIEMSNKYKGEELTAWEQNAINKAFPETGVWERLDSILDPENTNFWNKYEDWKNSSTPTPREKAGWYTDLTREINEARAKAITAVRNQVGPEADKFDQKIEMIDARNRLSKGNYYQGASEAQQQLQQLTKPF